MYQYNNQSTQISSNRKVVVYARVSTEHEAQIAALENQKDWYVPFLQQHPEWELIRMYVDEGITGTSAKKRPQFMKMIQDADSGEFDLILTREVSRFARNTVDTLQYTRDLKAKGVEVFFINDNIKTFDGDGELRLTIMATLAQDESRKTSIRVKSGQQTSMENGVFYGNGNILGYDRVGKEMKINPEQAKTVRMIFDWYLKGLGIRAIQFKLEQEGILTATGKTRWYVSNISKILTNSFYCGIITYHKQYTPDYLEQKKINNLGEIQLTKVKGRHQPIVSEEEFDIVQNKMNKRRREYPSCEAGKKRILGEKPPSDVWTELMECECGHKFNRKIWHRTENCIQYGYQCYSSIRSGTVRTRRNKGLSVDGVCNVPMIAGWKLQMMAKRIFKECLYNIQQVIDLAELILDTHINRKDSSNKIIKSIQEKQNERVKLSRRIDNLIEMRADGDITRDEFRIKKEMIASQITKIDSEIEQLNKQIEGLDLEVSHKEKIKLLRFYLEQSVVPSESEDIADDVIRAFVRKIIVHPDGFDWYLRFNPDNAPERMRIEGKRKTNAKISSLCSLQDRLLLAKEGNDSSLLERINQSSFVKVHEFTIELGEAKAYLYSYSTRHRVHRWDDLIISVFL